jgi:F-box-like
MPETNTSEVSFVHNVITDAQNTLAHINAGIARLQAERNSTSLCLHKLKALASPIRRMPVEVITYIFCWSLPDEPNLMVSRSPLVLGRVCCDWRRISLSTPQLWSSLHLKFWLEGSTPFTEIAIETWFSRSRNCPLTFTVQGGQLAPSLIQCLAKFSERWKHVNIYFPPSFLAYLSAVRNRLPCLQTLDLGVCLGREGVAQVVDAFKNAPQLWAVALPNCAKPSLFQLPWHQLTKLFVSGIAIEDVLSALQRCPNLVELGVVEPALSDDESLRGDYTFPNRPIVDLHQLKYLDVSLTIQTEEFFDHLLLPALRDLSMITHLSLDEWPQSEFMSLLFRSSFNLTRLTFHDLGISAGELIEILQHTPLLVEFDFITYYFARDDSLMKRLIYDADSDEENPCLIRKLEVLTFRNDLFNNLSFVWDLVNSRWFPDESGSEDESRSNLREPSCLRKVILHIWEDKVEEFEKTIMPLLSECGDEGLDIEFMKR